MYHASKPPVTVPLSKAVKKGTLRKILRDAEIEPATFVKLLKK
jgi:predicted RNA binding protein YcfA (HicA-like mRNA interferase family)